MTNLGSPGVSSRSVSGFFDQNQKSRLAPKNIPNGYFYTKNSTAELKVQFIVFLALLGRALRQQGPGALLATMHEGFKPRNLNLEI